MLNKSELFVVDTPPLDNLPKDVLNDFKLWVLNDQIKPSVAVHKLMDKYNCPKLHSNTVLQLVKLTYPDIDMAARDFSFNIVDSAYPNSDPNQFGDEDFDKDIEELQSLSLLLSLPPEEW